VKLTKNFHLDEFITSETAERHSIDMTVPEQLMPNLLRVAVAMQHIRDFLGVPVVITSGYRPAVLNRRVGGSTDSDHIRAAAADFIAPGYGSPYEVARAIAPKLDEFGIEQVIHEFGRWVHIGVVPVASINRVITIDTASVRTGIHPARMFA
jgi:zinc D-Ala-D-Ala carboxypeptidase